MKFSEEVLSTKTILLYVQDGTNFNLFLPIILQAEMAMEFLALVKVCSLNAALA